MPTANDYEVLAKRNYPDLKASGICSAHRDDGHYECQRCYPSWPALLDAHMEVSNKLCDDLLKISGLQDPPNGRIGTNAIVAEIKRKLCRRGIPAWHLLVMLVGSAIVAFIMTVLFDR
jgi:hypothetical protein